MFRPQASLLLISILTINVLAIHIHHPVPRSIQLAHVESTPAPAPLQTPKPIPYIEYLDLKRRDPSPQLQHLDLRQAAAQNQAAAAPAAPAAAANNNNAAAANQQAAAAPAAPAAAANNNNAAAANQQAAAAPAAPAAPAAGVGGAGNAAAPAQPGANQQANPVTTIMVESVIDGVTTQVPVAFTQTFGEGVSAPPVQSGSIGMGTLTGKIGVVKTANAAKGDAPPFAGSRGGSTWRERGGVVLVAGMAIMLGGGFLGVGML